MYFNCIDKCRVACVLNFTSHLGMGTESKNQSMDVAGEKRGVWGRYRLHLRHQVRLQALIAEKLIKQRTIRCRKD